MTTYTTAIADSDFRTIMFLQMCTHGSLPSRTLNTRMCMYMYIYFYLHVCVCCLLFLRTHTTHVAHTQTDMVSEHSFCDKFFICGVWTHRARLFHTHTKHMAHCTHKKHTMAHFTHTTHMASSTQISVWLPNMPRSLVRYRYKHMCNLNSARCFLKMVRYEHTSLIGVSYPLKTPSLVGVPSIRSFSGLCSFVGS